MTPTPAAPSAAGVALIALGGSLGTLARFALVQASYAWLPPAPKPAFPWGTLAVNLLGCFAMGILTSALTANLRDDLRAALLVGVLGGFTTFSAFAFESCTLWSAGRHAAAASYVLASVGLGLCLLAAGTKLATAFIAPR